MGMYDQLKFFGNTPVKCAEGHLVWEFQTKSLNRDMDSYYVATSPDAGGYRLFVHNRALDSQRQKPFIEVSATVLEEKLTVVYELVTYTGEVEIHTFCEKCLSVVHVGDNKSRWDMFNETYPWVEWMLRFEDGKLTESRVIRNQTRDEIRKELVGYGYYVPEDSNPLVLRFREQKDK